LKHTPFAVRLLLVSAASLFGAARGPEAQPLTLNQAIQRTLERHPALQIQRRAIEEAQGQRTAAGLLPNPALSYSREDLRLGGREGGEWILSAGLPLNFLWERQPGVDAASARVEAEQFALANEQRLIRFEAQKAFVEHNYLPFALSG